MRLCAAGVASLSSIEMHMKISQYIAIDQSVMFYYSRVIHDKIFHNLLVISSNASVNRLSQHIVHRFFYNQAYIQSKINLSNQANGIRLASCFVLILFINENADSHE